MNLYNELPIVFPFYQNEKHLNSRKQHIENNCIFKLVSPKNALLPFQIDLKTDVEAPIAWQISTLCGGTVIDITNNLNEVKIYSFEDKKQAVYFGNALTFVYDVINQPLNLPTGFYFSKFIFPDGSYLISEVFYVPDDSFNVGEPVNYFRIEFWNDSDILPVIYRDGWKQTVYLKTFIHAAVPELDEDVKKDGNGSDIPVFQKLSLKYKFTDVVPDFLKIALVSLQMMDSVYILTDDERSGKIDRVLVNVEQDENNGLNIVSVTFEDKILVKTACVNDKSLLNLSSW